MSSRYTSDTGDFAIRQKAVFLNGEQGRKEWLQPQKLKEPTAETYEQSLGVAYWGANNNLPAEMTADIEATGILSGAIDLKSRIGSGKGPMPALIKNITPDGQEVLEFINDNEIDDWLEMNNAWKYSIDTMIDLFSYGSAFTKMLTSPDRKMVTHFKRTQSNKCRFSVIGKSGRPENVFISGDWSRYTNPKSEYVQTIPLLDRDYPLLDLHSRTSGNIFMLALQYSLRGRDYYPPSPWYSAQKWVKIAQGIPEMKKAMFDNQMTIKYLISIHPKYWELMTPGWSSLKDTEQKKIKEEFYDTVHETLVGGENAYKTIWSSQVMDDETQKLVDAVKIEAIDDKIKDGKLLPDSNAADIEILLPLMLNPSLFGVDFGGADAYGGGAGSGSNIREAYLAQVMLMETERRMTSSVFDIAKRLNGWHDKYRGQGRLVLRYPSLILTTLNTGANTQSVNT